MSGSGLPGLGELAALGAAVVWSIGSLLFAHLARRLGARATNLFRVSLAAAILVATRAVLLGRPFPGELEWTPLSLLIVSGVVGLTFGDGCYFRSFVLVGPRIGSLLMSLVPVFTAIIGWVYLDERIGARALAGMSLTLVGIATVVLERAPTGAGQGRIGLGSLYGLGAASGQAVGLILAKRAMDHVAVLDATIIRLLAAMAACWLLAFLHRDVGRSLRDLARAGVVAPLAVAALLGPCVGVWLSLVAVRHTDTAVAATLMALVPVLVLPLVAIVYRERVSGRAVTGALIAFAGVALVVSR